jgi:aromatic-L-amino-acid decarboxylase
MFTNFDCSLFYTKDKSTLIRTFEIMPEYLKTENDTTVNNYRDWGIQLGRRFRALKLWFVLRSYGLDGIKVKFREHIGLARYFADKLHEDPDFELLAPVPLNLVCFRYHPQHAVAEDLNELNALLEKQINDSGEAYITHTKIDGKYTLRACIGQTNVEKRHVDALFELLKERARLLEH